MGRALLGGQQEQAAIAYHEIGHAIVGTIVSLIPFKKVTLVPRGQAAARRFMPSEDQV